MKKINSIIPVLVSFLFQATSSVALAQSPFPETPSSSVIGQVKLPSFFKYGGVEGGLGKFLNNIFILIMVGGGIYALVNFLTAGYAYMGAKGDEKKIGEAWAKIWQSLMGLLIMGAAFLIAAIVGLIFFGDPGFILHPKIYGPD